MLSKAIAPFPQITKRAIAFPTSNPCMAIAPFHPAIPKAIALILRKCDRFFPMSNPCMAIAPKNSTTHQ
ncbi:hypothetical protein [Microcoleus sp. herbarium14]|uniref:hypothetical protein n=1 Tax=Microcoleus sp. herbarium14 TaxID=3055439 RepID=UPI002FCFFB77